MNNIYARDGLFTVGLERELELYREMQTIAQNEQKVLSGPDPASNLIPLLERKNAILEEIAKIEAEIAGYKTAWKESPAVSLADKEHLSAVVGEIGDILRDLITGELTAEEQFNEKYPDRGSESKVSHRGVGSVAMAAYSNSVRK